MVIHGFKSHNALDGRKDVLSDGFRYPVGGYEYICNTYLYDHITQHRRSSS